MNNIALITGASSGIGKELAYIHASKGDLILVSRNINELNTIKFDIETKFNNKVICIKKDLSIINEVFNLYEEVKKYNISILINNAGVGMQGEFINLDINKQIDMINLNITSLTILTNLFSKNFKNNEGKILNVSSIAAFNPGPMLAVYSATKAYVLSLSNALYEELSNTNITITTLVPGITKTNFAKNSKMDKTIIFRKSYDANIVATKGYNAMLKGKLNIVYKLSFKLKILFFFSKFVPKKLSLKIIKNLQK